VLRVFSRFPAFLLSLASHFFLDRQLAVGGLEWNGLDSIRMVHSLSIIIIIMITGVGYGGLFMTDRQTEAAGYPSPRQAEARSRP
jgi:hypothetical protein